MRIQMHLKTRYVDEAALVEFARYGNGRTAIKLVAADTGESLSIATVNIPECYLPDEDLVILKGWSENEGIPAALEAAGIVGPSLAEVPSGFAVATVHRLLVNPS